MPLNPLDALRALSQTNDFNPVKLAGLRGIRESELANRARDPRQDAILQALRGEMVADPYTGAAAQKEQLGRESEYNDALSQGFTGGPVQANGIPLSPVQQLNKYKQGMELHKIEGPERVARIGADANLGVARVNAQGDIDKQKVANEQGNVNLENARAKNLSGEFDLLQGFLNSNGARSSSVRTPSGFAISQGAEPSQNVNPTLLAGLRKAVQDSAAQKPGADIAFNTAVEGIIHNYNTDPHTKELVKKVINDPTFEGKSVGDVFAEYGQGATEKEKQDFLALYNLIQSAMQGQ